MRFGLVGPSYASQSLNADAQMCMNWYLEQIESGAGNAPLVLYPTPGTKTFVNLQRTISPPVNGMGSFESFVENHTTGATGTAVTTPSDSGVNPSLALFQVADSAITGVTPAAGWNNFDVSSNLYYQIVNGAISGSATLGVASNWAAILGLFNLFGGAVPTIVQQSALSGAIVAGAHPLAFGFNVTKGNYILAIMRGNLSNGTAFTATDSLGNTYNQIASSQATGAGGSNNSQIIWLLAQANSTGADTVTLTTSASISGDIKIYEIQAGSATVVQSGPIRGEITINGRTFAVSGTDFDEVFASGTFTNWGTVANDALPVTMAASPQQILIASAGTAYVFDLMANTLTAIPGATFSGPVSQAAICDGFFILTIAGTKAFYVSGPLNANDWVTNGSAIVSVFADNIVSMLVHDRELWFWSDRERTVYYDSGNIFPFDVIPGTTIQAGSAAKSAPVRLDDRVMWLNSDDNGTATVKMGSGYTPTRVSNHAIEFAMQGYSRVDDVAAYSYQDQGHSFYVLYFPTPSKTWVYDVVTGMWHERGFWQTSIGDFRAHHSQCHTFNFGKHLVGDWQSAKIYQLKIPTLTGTTWTFADDDGNPIRRVRRAPHISKEQKRIFIRELQVYLETGLGPQPPLLGSGSTGLFTFFVSTVNATTMNVTLPQQVAVGQTMVVLLKTNPADLSVSGCITSLLGNVPHRISSVSISPADFDAYIIPVTVGGTEKLTITPSTGLQADMNLIGFVCQGVNAGGGSTDGPPLGQVANVGTTFSTRTLTTTVPDLVVACVGVSGAVAPTPTDAFPLIVSNLGLAMVALPENVAAAYTSNWAKSGSGFVITIIYGMTMASLGSGSVVGSGATAQPRGPILTLRWSVDGGHTWSNAYDRDCGLSGEFKKRVRWNRLGSGRDFVFELSGADPVGYRVVDGYVNPPRGAEE